MKKGIVICLTSITAIAGIVGIVIAVIRGKREYAVKKLGEYPEF